jgi:hypothetical protein
VRDVPKIKLVLKVGGLASLGCRGGQGGLWGDAAEDGAKERRGCAAEGGMVAEDKAQGGRRGHTIP